MKRKEFVSCLDRFLEIENYPDFCPNGLQVEGSEEVTNVATAVSATLQTINAAIDAEVDTLIVHHGLFWNKDPYPVLGPKREKLRLLLEKQINLVAYHLPLDAHPYVGNNWVAARALGWHDIEVSSGVGVKGTLASVPIEAFVKRVETYYGHKANAALFGPKEIKTVALVSGGAWRNMLDEETDCFITGNFDEPAWGWAQEHKKHFLALGHSATEEIGPKALAEHISKTMGILTKFLKIENPF